MIVVRPSQLSIPLLLLALAADRPAVAREVAVTASARGETDPVATEKDSADDPAIWVHPTDPSRSLVFGSNRKGGLHACTLDGKQRHLISPAARPNHVEVLYGFGLGGRRADLAVATTRPSGTAAGLRFWTIDPADGRLAEVAGGRVFPTHDGNDSYGLCHYRGAGGADYPFVTNHQGGVEQDRL